MSGVEIFGFVCVSVMLVAYAFEKRSRAWVLVFAVGCLGAAAYAAMIRSWPFAAVEAIWVVVAVIRWRRLAEARAP